MTAAFIALATISEPSLTVIDVPTDVSGYGNTGTSANITTGLVVATPAGGITPYSYAWTQSSPSPYTWTISAAAAASTSFTCVSLGVGTTAEADFQVTVTDAAGSKAIAAVTAFANNGQPYDSRSRTGQPLL